MSPRRLSGWEPVTVTTFERDEAGQVIGMKEEREPEWSRTDVESLIALLEMQRVGPHGHPMSEATSELANPQNANQQWRYESEPVTDFAAQAESNAIKAFRKRYGDDADMAATKWITHKVPIKRPEAESE